MAAPNQPILDTFNRADGGLGSNWTSPIWVGDDNPAIVSNTFRGGNSTGSDGDGYWNVASYTESEVYITVTTLPSAGTGPYLMARIQSPNSAGMDAYQLYCAKVAGAGNDTWVLNRVINEASTLLANGTQEFSAGDSFGLVVLGTGATVTVQAWYRASGGSWVQLGSDYSDTNAARITAAGRIGVGCQGNVGRLDDFGGGEQAAASANRLSPVAVVAPALPLAYMEV